jgi:hypothetical protein
VPKRVSWTSLWHAASKRSNTLRECSGGFLELALRNIARNGSHAIRPSSSTEPRFNEWTSLHPCNRHALTLAARVIRPPSQPQRLRGG